jgi:hypothetical protein
MRSSSFEMAGSRLDGGASLELALGLRRHAALLAGGVDVHLVLGRCVVAHKKAQLTALSPSFNPSGIKPEDFHNARALRGC